MRLPRCVRRRSLEARIVLGCEPIAEVLDDIEGCAIQTRCLSRTDRPLLQRGSCGAHHQRDGSRLRKTARLAGDGNREQSRIRHLGRYENQFARAGCAIRIEWSLSRPG